MLPALSTHKSVTVKDVQPVPKIFTSSTKALFVLLAPFKVLWQLLALWHAMACDPNVPEWMLVQNPPAIPTLILAVVACQIRGTKLVIDWHNFGYSILALKLGQDHPLVKISKVYEKAVSNSAYANFAVTNAMCSQLKSQFGIKSPVLALHDRPAPIFRPLSLEQRLAFLTRHELTAAESSSIIDGKTRLLVSSTSWTADEDFSVLLEALQSYTAHATSDLPQLPELLVVITGKGPLKDHYMRQVEKLTASLDLEMVTIKSAWLSFADYALLLGAADLGISLHTSSSGVDLPMKVVDMFGTGLPVLGYSNFKAWPELVIEGVNGQGFTTAAEMAGKLRELCEPTSKTLEKLRKGAIIESERRWESEWDSVAGRLMGFVP